jgi:hypothetical protein
MANNFLDALTSVAGLEEKTASSILKTDDLPGVNTTLQNEIGDPYDTYISTFAQFAPNPGNSLIPNPNSPTGGDDMFFMYLIPGAKFQAKDGSQWLILDYLWEGMVEIENVWYPRLKPIISIQQLRRTIAAWIEPVQVTIPDPPIGVDYGVVETRQVK